MNIRTFIITTIIYFLSINAIAQNKAQIDSLNNKLLRSNKDTCKIHILLNIGNLFESKDTTLKYYKQALVIAEKLKNKKEIVNCFEHFGQFYEKNNNYNKALFMYQKSLELNKKLNNKIKIANNFNSIGNLYYYKSSFDKALKNYQESLKLNKKTNNKIGIARNL